MLFNSVYYQHFWIILIITNGSLGLRVEPPFIGDTLQSFCADSSTLDRMYVLTSNCSIYGQRSCGIVPFEIVTCINQDFADISIAEFPQGQHIRINFRTAELSLCKVSLQLEADTQDYKMSYSSDCKRYAPSDMYSNCGDFTSNEAILVEREVTVSCPHNSVYTAYSLYGYASGILVCSFVSILILQWNRYNFPHKRNKEILREARKDRGNKANWGKSLMGVVRKHDGDLDGNTISAYQVEQALSQIETAARSVMRSTAI